MTSDEAITYLTTHQSEFGTMLPRLHQAVEIVLESHRSLEARIQTEVREAFMAAWHARCAARHDWGPPGDWEEAYAAYLAQRRTQETEG